MPKVDKVDTPPPRVLRVVPKSLGVVPRVRKQVDRRGGWYLIDGQAAGKALNWGRPAVAKVLGVFHRVLGYHKRSQRYMQGTRGTTQGTRGITDGTSGTTHGTEGTTQDRRVHLGIGGITPATQYPLGWTWARIWPSVCHTHVDMCMACIMHPQPANASTKSHCGPGVLLRASCHLQCRYRQTLAGCARGSLTVPCVYIARARADWTHNNAEGPLLLPHYGVLDSTGRSCLVHSWKPPFMNRILV